jgi:hypothetical protein
MDNLKILDISPSTVTQDQHQINSAVALRNTQQDRPLIVITF